MDELEIPVPLLDKGRGTPALLWRDWGCSLLVFRHYRWRVRLGPGPYKPEGEIPWPEATLTRCAGWSNSSSLRVLDWKGERRGCDGWPCWNGPLLEAL